MKVRDEDSDSVTDLKIMFEVKNKDAITQEEITTF
jgi:hypothetical protein